ncbi:MAG: patatin-like phospholipase family protein [Myxococcales bacterium]|nr:patatin-like phospholipase family protein [Myxococcales bacterium]
MASVLYLVASPAAAAELVGAVGLVVEATGDVADAVARSLAGHHDAVLIDVDVDGGAAGGALQLLDRFLAGLRAERDRERRIRRDRILAVVHGDSGAVERTIFELGHRRIGGYLHGPTDDDAGRARFVAAVRARLAAAAAPPPSRKALCAAGGGISGVYYEVGVLKCLEDTLGGFSVHDFDMYFGISAGAIVTSLVANGVSLDQLIHDLDPRRPGGHDLEFRLRDLTLGDLPRRAMAVVEHLAEYRARVKSGEEKLSLTAALSQFAALSGPFFHGDAKRREMVAWLTEQGHVDDFRRLRRELYIGATDQDSREHVLFGAEPFRHVPISQAVQASAAIHPFLAPVTIDGRRYTDGFVTRTTNIAAALDRGANLVVILDPFLPYIADKAGFNDRHSLFWVLVQDYKTVAYTRYDKVSSALLETHPSVACLAFLPSNRMRRLLASSPISTGNYDAIISQAYASTYRRLARMAYRFGPVLAEHGIELTLDRAARRVRLLDAMPSPRAAALAA